MCRITWKLFFIQKLSSRENVRTKSEPIFFRAGLRKFGLKSFALQTICFLLHLCAALHHLPRFLRSTVTCNKPPTTVPWSKRLKIWCCYCYEIRTNRYALASFAAWLCRPKNRHEWSAISSLHDTTKMNLALVHCAGHIDHRCRSRQIFGGAKDLCPIFLKLPRKNFGPLLCEYFLMKTVFGMKKVFMWFCTRWGPIFFKSTHVGRHFCPYFQRVCPDFQGYCQGFHIFCPDFRGFCRFSGIFHGFSPHQNFWGSASILTSYTSDIGKQTVIARSK